jgi:hypothetical protein
MYAVVYKNRVIVGPMVWNRAIFQGSLEKEKIKVQLPRVAPENLPYIINEDAKIMLVEENRPPLNPLVEYYYGPLWDLTGNKAVANFEVNDTAIESARYNLKQQAAEERWKRETAGTKTVIQNIEVTVDTSRDGRNIFVQKYALMADDELVNWKFPERWLTLSRSELGQAITAGATYVQSCFDWERSISDQIDSSLTKQELLAIKIVDSHEPLPGLLDDTSESQSTDR